MRITDYDISDIGSIKFTLNYDEDEYAEYLEDNEVPDCKETQLEFVKDNCSYDVEFTDSEYYHHLGYDTMYYDEIESMFGENLANDVLNDCMDGQEHDFEPQSYATEELNLEDPDVLSNAAMKYLKHGEYFKNARGFILPNGVVVYTETEHNQCSKVPGVKGTFHFIGLGCIRILDHSIDLAKAPTDAQIKTLYKVLRNYYSEELYVDLMNKQIGNFSKKYDYCDPDDVISDIQKYFKGIIHKSSIFEAKTDKAMKLYHWSTNVVTEPRIKGNCGYGFYMAKNKKYSRLFGDILHRVIVKPENTLVFNDKEVKQNAFFNIDKQHYDDYINAGYDSLAWYRNGELCEFIALKPEIIRDIEVIGYMHENVRKKPIRLTESNLHEIVKKCVTKIFEKLLNENLKTHDDEYNLYEKLDELDISYDYINERENIIEIDTPNEGTKEKVLQLLNYYGWKKIKDNGYSVCAERIYGDLWNNFYDTEADKDDDYPHGIGIYYHITPSYKVPKILKQGLTVREGNKLGYARGNRTYLISYPSKDFASSLFKDSKEKMNVTILLVDIRKYLGKKINIYHDDFTYDDGAVYTCDYIPPQCIKVYDTFEF